MVEATHLWVAHHSHTILLHRVVTLLEFEVRLSTLGIARYATENLRHALAEWHFIAIGHRDVDKLRLRHIALERIATLGISCHAVESIGYHHTLQRCARSRCHTTIDGRAIGLWLYCSSIVIVEISAYNLGVGCVWYDVILATSRSDEFATVGTIDNLNRCGIGRYRASCNGTCVDGVVVIGVVTALTAHHLAEVVATTELRSVCRRLDRAHRTHHSTNEGGLRTYARKDHLTTIVAVVEVRLGRHCAYNTSEKGHTLGCRGHLSVVVASCDVHLGVRHTHNTCHTGLVYAPGIYIAEVVTADDVGVGVTCDTTHIDVSIHRTLEGCSIDIASVNTPLHRCLHRLT